MKDKGMSSLLFRLVSIVLIVGILTMGMASSVVAAGGSPSITTDKTKYSLGEPAVISGSGFTAESTVNVDVLRPDHETDRLEPVTTDAAGAFQTTYYPPYIPGRYKITATDGVGLAAEAFTQADPPTVGITMEGYNIPTTGGFTLEWITGNLGKSYDEGEWVPYQTTITGIQDVYPNMTGMPDIVIGWDFTGGNKADSPRFGDLVRDIQVGLTKLTNAQGFPRSNGTAYVISTLAGANVPQNDPDENQWLGFQLLNLPESQVNLPLTGSGSVIDDVHTFVIHVSDLTSHGIPASTDTFYIYYQIHESRTFVWNNGLQAGYDASPTDAWGGYLYSAAPYDTDKRLGSGFVPGSSGHVHNEGVGGAKDVPLPIPPEPAGLIDGYKFNDADSSGTDMTGNESGIQGWRVYIGGYIEGLPLFITSVLTDANGYFSFGNLTAGTWYIAENIARESPVETFWNQTYPNSGTGLVSPVATPLLSSSIPFVFPTTPTLGPWAYRVDLTATNLTQHHVDFGNVGKGCLTITKELSIPVGVPLGLLDGTFIINVANVTFGFSQNLTFTMTDGVVSGPQTIYNLIPGIYTLTEPGLPSYWAPTAGLGSVTVSSSGTCAARTVTNTYTPGCLTITKELNLNGYLFANNVTMDFIVNVANVTFGFSQNLTFHVVNGVLQAPTSVTLENLIPGTYNVTEVNPGIMWTVTGQGIVTVNSGTPCAAKTISNTIKLPNTSINITADVYETTPGGNVWLYISDTNDGQVPLTDPHIHLLIGGAEFDANNVTGGIQPLTKGDAYWSVGAPSWVLSPGTPNGDTNNNGIMDVSETWSWAVQITLNATTNITVNGHGTDPLGNPVDGPTYIDETDTITVQVGGATRTWGFWKTHLYLVQWMFNATAPGSPHITSIYMGTWRNYTGVQQVHNITSICRYMGLMWSDQSKSSNRAMRTNIDNARIHTAHQALAAIMNSYMPGGAPLPAGITLESIATTLSSNNITAIRNLGSALANYNESGDDIALDPSMPPTGKTNNADPQGARLAGATCIPYWDTPRR